MPTPRQPTSAPRCQLRVTRCRGHERPAYNSWFDVGLAASCSQRIAAWKVACGSGAAVEARLQRPANHLPPPPPPQASRGEPALWPVEAARAVLTQLREGWRGHEHEASAAAATLPQVGPHGWIVPHDRLDSPPPKVGCEEPPCSSRTQHTLLVWCGLLRYFRQGWEGLQKPLFAANPEVSFDVAVLTALTVVCTDKDRAFGECPCIEPLPKTTSKLLEELRRLFAPRRLVFSQVSTVCRPSSAPLTTTLCLMQAAHRT